MEKPFRCRGWIQLSKSESVFHDNGIGKPELKFGLVSLGTLWDNKPFLWHYWMGGGDTMNITSDSDLGKEIKKHLNNLMTQQCKEITQEAQVCGLYTTTKKNNDIDFTNNQKLFSLGNSNLTTSALCMNGKCLLAFEIKDAFIDAKDINDSVPGNQDYWLSSPYDIYYSSTMNCWQ